MKLYIQHNKPVFLHGHDDFVVAVTGRGFVVAIFGGLVVGSETEILANMVQSHYFSM